MSLSQTVDPHSRALKLSSLIGGIPLVRAEAHMMLVTLRFRVICGRNLVARQVCHGTEVVGGTLTHSRLVFNVSVCVFHKSFC